MRRFLPLIALALLATPAHPQDAQPDLQKTFDAANTLLEKKQYAAALTEYRKILAVEPDAEGPLQNGAMAAFFAGDYKAALQYYRKLKAADPNSGFFRAKLVQVYQAMGDAKARDAERSALLALHKSGKDTSTLAKRADFCREQYKIGERHVLVYEPWEFKPRRDGLFAVRYQFFVTDANGELETRIETGWNAVKKDAKGVYRPDTLSAFYFDAYYPTGPYARRTMGLSEKELPYTAVKAHVQAIVEGKVTPTGGTLRKETGPATTPANP